MNSEARTAFKIRQLLDEGCREIDPAVVTRLALSRGEALSRKKAASHEGRLSLPGLGNWSIHTTLHGARNLIAVTALLIGMAGAYYWNEFQTADENADIDSALLADDLPIAAYTDQGFRAWIEHSAQSPQQ
ncbi:MAG: DUF3619 family protein [Rhodocyclaceae bacterium]|jgi:hypothetical protein|nr:DUF3619 family protein [Rhodocyclaceae bacterium]